MDPETPETQTTEGERSSVPECPIGPYKLLKELGRGGMGAVYLAARADEHYQKRVAIKIIKAGTDSAEVVRHFRRERQILAGLDHPNIARLLDGGATEDCLPYIVMEYIQGQSLHEYCDSRRLPIVERLKVFQQVCSAVAYAHRNLIVHRDLKPSNILVTAEGVPRLLDFGIAKLLNPEVSGEAPTATGLVLTPEYASPEQARGENVTTASDVYSLGVLLYELLTGHRPYRLKTRQPLEVLRAVCEEEPERPSTIVERTEEVTEGSSTVAVTPEGVGRMRDATPERLRRGLRGDLDDIVLMALRKEPQRRYQSVEALSEDVRRYLEGLPVKAGKGTAIYRAGKYVRRHAVGVTAAAALVLLLVTLAVTMTVQSARLARERDRAARERDKADKVSAFLVDLFKVSDPSEAKGNTVTAREILEKGAEKIAGQLKEQPDVKAALMDTMSRVYDALGLYDKALTLGEEALALRRQSLGNERVEVAQSLQNLANVLEDKGDYTKAETLYREALAIRRTLLGNEHPDVAGTLNNLALILQDKGDYPGAEAIYREVLAMRRKALGNEHPEVAMSLHNLAGLLLVKGDYAGAEPLYREALAMKRKIQDNSPSVADSLDGLAGVLYSNGDYAGAEVLFRETLTIRRKLLGNEHPYVARTLNGLAGVLYAEGDYAGAEAVQREVLAILHKTLGDKHPAVATGLNNLALFLDQEGDYAEAEALHREALAMRRKLLANEHPDLAQSLNNLALVLDHEGNFAEAETLDRQALTIWRKALGNKHPLVAESLSNLGQALYHEHYFVQAERAFRDSLEIRREALPADHPEVADSLSGLGKVLMAQGQVPLAEVMLREGFDIRRKKLPKDHPDVAEVESDLAACIIRLRKFDEAEPLLLVSYPILLAKRNASRATREARQHLIDLYTAWGKPEKAREYAATPAKVGNP